MASPFCECGSVLELRDGVLVCDSCGKKTIPLAVPVTQPAPFLDESLRFGPEDVGIAAPKKPRYSLSSPMTVALAGLVGGWVGGGIVLAFNYWNVRHRAFAVVCLVVALLAAIAYDIAIPYIVDVDPGWDAARTLVPMLVVQQLAAALVCGLACLLLQWRLLAFHRRTGGAFDPYRSWIRTSLIVGFVVLAIQAATNYPFPFFSRVFEYSPSQEMLVGGEISRARAFRVGDHMCAHGIFRREEGTRQQVVLLKNGDVYEIRFFFGSANPFVRLPPEFAAWNDPEWVDRMRSLRDACARDPFSDAPVHVVMCDTAGIRRRILRPLDEKD